MSKVRKRAKIAKSSLIREAKSLGLKISTKERYNNLVTIVNTEIWVRSRKKDKIA